MRLFARVLLSLALLLALCICSYLTSAQTETATVSGRVTDPLGQVVPDVQIELVNTETNVVQTVKTNGEGLYVFPSVKPGRYRILVVKDGFKEIVKTGVVLHVQDSAAENFSLQVGSVSESVTVTAGGLNINTTDATVSTVVDRQFVENIPLNGRSFQSLISLIPGTVVTKTSFNEQGQFSVNGQRADANYFTVDGVSANVGISAGGPLVQSAGGELPGFGVTGGTNSLVSVDALQEFKIQTSTYAPEFGRTPGAQISILTRSGTNQFHGTLFDYLRNDVLDANDWFANNKGLKKPEERQNDFGGTLGGPILKDKTFFFFSYEGLRLRLPQTVISSVPTLSTRQSAPAGIQPFLNAYPRPNGTDFGNGFAQFAGAFSIPSTLNSTSVRIDHSVNQHLILFSRFNYVPSHTIQRGANSTSLTSLNDVGINVLTLTIGATQSITPRISNEVRGNYSRSSGTSSFDLDNFGGAVVPPDSVLFPSFTSRQHGFFSIAITGLPTLQVGANAQNKQRQLNLVDNFSALRNSHQLKFGVDYRRLLPINRVSDYAQAVFFSGLTGPTGALGGIAQRVIISTRDIVPLVVNNLSVYGQDTWRASRRLTLTYGLRWELNPPLKGRNGKDLLTVNGLDNPAALIANPTSVTLAPKGTPLYRTTYGNFAPRLGVAYQLTDKPDREMIVRGGFGVFYDLGVGSLGTASVFFPFGVTKTFASVPYPLTVQQLQPPVVSLNTPFGTIQVADPHLRLPYTYQWNVAVERFVGKNQTISATYVGAIGRRLLRAEAITNPAFGSIRLTRNTATSDYHALQLQFQRRLSRGLQALVSYTWSHSIDIASNDSGSTASATFYNPNLDRGSSDYDVRHSFSGALTYDLPSPGKQKLVRAILGGWSLDTLMIARSALPIDLIGSFFTVGGTLVTARPNIVAGIPLYLFGSQYPGGKILNNTPNQGGTGCKGPFCPAAPGTQGNLSRNALRGFPAWQDDLTIRRQFPLSERTNLQFRAEFFNVFNHPNFGDPTSILFFPTFGQTTSMLGRSLGSGGINGGFNPLYQIGGPRSIQFALKIQF